MLISLGVLCHWSGVTPVKSPTKYININFFSLKYSHADSFLASLLKNCISTLSREISTSY